MTHEPLPEPVTALPGEVDAGDEPVQQDFGIDPLAVRHTDHYRWEYVKTFAEKWDELIDWERRAEGEGDFFLENTEAPRRPPGGVSICWAFWTRAASDRWRPTGTSPGTDIKLIERRPLRWRTFPHRSRAAGGGE